jgi:hypothetical protein
MSRTPLSRRVIGLLLILAVAVPLTASPIHSSDPVHFEATAPLASLWGWLSHVWAKNGCMIDPNGPCLPATGSIPAPPAGADDGCGIDPSGRCQSAPNPLPAAENGCGIDPNGRCRS